MDIMAIMDMDMPATDEMALVATMPNTDNFNTMVIMDMATAATDATVLVATMLNMDNFNTAATGGMDPVAMVTMAITGKISP